MMLYQHTDQPTKGTNTQPSINILALSSKEPKQLRSRPMPEPSRQELLESLRNGIDEYFNAEAEQTSVDIATSILAISAEINRSPHFTPMERNLITFLISDQISMLENSGITPSEEMLLTLESHIDQRLTLLEGNNLIPSEQQQSVQEFVVRYTNVSIEEATGNYIAPLIPDTEIDHILIGLDSEVFQSFVEEKFRYWHVQTAEDLELLSQWGFRVDMATGRFTHTSHDTGISTLTDPASLPPLYGSEPFDQASQAYVSDLLDKFFPDLAADEKSEALSSEAGLRLVTMPLIENLDLSALSPDDRIELSALLKFMANHSQTEGPNQLQLTNLGQQLLEYLDTDSVAYALQQDQLINVHMYDRFSADFLRLNPNEQWNIILSGDPFNDINYYATLEANYPGSAHGISTTRQLYESYIANGGIAERITFTYSGDLNELAPAGTDLANISLASAGFTSGAWAGIEELRNRGIPVFSGAGNLARHAGENLTGSNILSIGGDSCGLIPPEEQTITIYDIETRSNVPIPIEEYIASVYPDGNAPQYLLDQANGLARFNAPQQDNIINIDICGAEGSVNQTGTSYNSPYAAGAAAAELQQRYAAQPAISPLPTPPVPNSSPPTGLGQ